MSRFSVSLKEKLMFFAKFYHIGATIDDCPSTACWEIVEDECSLKSTCNTNLSCTPDEMDFKFNFNELIGADNTINQELEADSCPPTAYSQDGQDSVGYILTKPFYIIFSGKNIPSSCRIRMISPL